MLLSQSPNELPLHWYVPVTEQDSPKTGQVLEDERADVNEVVVVVLVLVVDEELVVEEEVATIFLISAVIG